MVVRPADPPPSFGAGLNVHVAEKARSQQVRSLLPAPRAAGLRRKCARRMPWCALTATNLEQMNIEKRRRTARSFVQVKA